MPRRQKSELIRRFDNQCHYCGEQTNRTAGHRLQATIEHVVPRAFGGANSLDNYVLACSACNNERGSQLFYCECSFCGPLITTALANDVFISGMFQGLIKHNTPKVYKNGQGEWCVRIYHGRKHYESWEAAMEAALAWKGK